MRMTGRLHRLSSAGWNPGRSEEMVLDCRSQSRFQRSLERRVEDKMLAADPLILSLSKDLDLCTHVVRRAHHERDVVRRITPATARPEALEGPQQSS